MSVEGDATLITIRLREKNRTMGAKRKIVFVCEHGAAKSVVAAALLQRLAHEVGFEIEVLALGSAPDGDISPAAAAGLLAEGIDVRGSHPRRMTRADLNSASTIVSFGPELSHLAPENARIERWEGIPAVDDGYEAARTAILARLHRLVPEREA
jgi:arsenate reductase (thioredoxin)